MADQAYWAPSLQQSHRHGWNFAIDPSFTMPDVENALIISEYHAHQYPTEAPPIYLDGVSRDYYIPFQNSQSGFTRREGGLSATEAEITEGNNIISREMAENELPVYSQFSNSYAGEAGTVNMIPRITTEQAVSDSLEDALEHGIIEIEPSLTCWECHHQYRNKSALNSHARQALHSPWKCKCEKAFSRVDDLKRHIHSHQRTKKHSCPYCSKFKNERGFSRKDHLVQHIRNYHHIEDSLTIGSVETHCCPHKNCVYHTVTRQLVEGVSCLNTRSELTKHLRAAHNESPFPCPKRGCSRVGSQGYFRKKDLLLHQKNQHPPSHSFEQDSHRPVEVVESM